MSAKKLRKHNDPWSPGDITRLSVLADKKLSARLAARELGRSTGAIKYKAMVLGIRFQAINQPAGVQKRLARKSRRR